MKKIITFAAALSLSLAAFAGEGNAVMPLFQLNTNPQCAAQAGILLFDNPASAVWDTPHFSAFAGFQRVGLNSTNNFSADLSGNILGYAAIRARYAQMLESPYDMVNENGFPAGSFTPKSMLAAFGISGAAGKHVAFGVDFSFGRRSLAPDASYNAVTFDPAVMLRFAGFKAALSTRNLGIPVKSLSGEKFSVPSAAFVSAGYDLAIKNHHLVPAAEFEYMLSGGISAAASLRYSWKDVVNVMGGYRYGGLLPSHVSAGLGFNIKGFCINASMQYFTENKTANILAGVGYRF